MLHVIVSTHGPDTCPASVPTVREKYMPNFARLPEVSAKLGITVQGSWVDMPGHVSFMVADAPNAHAITQMLIDLHLMDWNTVVVHPVVEMQQAVQTADKRDI